MAKERTQVRPFSFMLSILYTVALGILMYLFLKNMVGGGILVPDDGNVLAKILSTIINIVTGVGSVVVIPFVGLLNFIVSLRAGGSRVLFIRIWGKVFALVSLVAIIAAIAIFALAQGGSIAFPV